MVELTEPNGQYDVVVIGGGPAGTTLATFLKRQGHSVLVLERSSFPRYHIGESLIPHTYGTLDRLGLLPKLKTSHFPVKHSVRFVSPSGKESDPFYFSETIPGDGAQTWQVERSEFDEICVNHARENGVDVRMNTIVNKVLFEGDKAVGVNVVINNKEMDIKSKVVVDASGSKTLIGNQLKIKQTIPTLNKASIWGYYKGGLRLPGIDAGETTIFMLPGRRWFWYIPLPNDIISVGIVGDPEYVFAESEDFTDILEGEAKKCAPMWERLKNAERIDSVRGIRRLAYRNQSFSGPGWVMIGDSAAFLDPIYSSGLYLALASAELAADSVHKALESENLSGDALGAHVPALLGGVEVIRRLIYAFYDENFSFGEFAKKYPNQRAALIDCLVGDVVGKDMQSFLDCLSEMTPVPEPL